jgi:hypothetical protein
VTTGFAACALTIDSVARGWTAIDVLRISGCAKCGGVVRLKVEIIVTNGTIATLEANNVPRSIPTVMSF